MEWEEALIDFLKERQKDPEKSRYMDIAFYTERSVLMINVGPKISKMYDIFLKILGPIWIKSIQTGRRPTR